MKSIIISLLLLFTVQAQNVWYVDRDATGSANGTSWANAWRTISSSNQISGGVNYSLISPGDTIYVSGGTDSTIYRAPSGIYSHRIYPSGSGITYASGNPVVIAPAWHSGHNGEVYIGAKDNNTEWILEIHNISNIKLTGLNFVDNRTGNRGTMLYLGGAGADGLGIQDSLITIENCHIVGNGRESMVYLEGYKITIKNCLIEQPENDLINDQDPFGLSGGRGEHTIDGCTIIMRNGNEVTGAHRDGIQISNIGDGIHTAKTQITISNNFIIDTNPNGISWNNMIYNYGWDYTPSIRFLIYNNIIVTQKRHTPLGGIAIGRLDHDYLNTVLLLNNTIIMKNNGVGNVVITWSIDSLISKNNLFVVDTTIGAFYNCDDAVNWALTYKDINYNHYAEYGGLSGYIGIAGDNYTWNQWQAANLDLNSVTGNSTAVTFDNKYGLNKSDYYTTTGRGTGVDLSSEYPFLAYDILGNPRTGTWDIGALEYQGGQSNNINVNGKVFLQGPFNTNSMRTDLGQGGLLPNNQPFSTAPWNYNGNESLSSGSSSSYVDWVLVELRNSSNPTQVAARKAAILKNDGTLLNSNGTTGVTFNNLAAGSYYVAVFHRNHLAVMSSVPVQLSANTPTYDFTTGLNKAFGQNPMKELAPGKYGMYAGDGNSNGGITITDRNDVWAIQNGTMGYLKGDFNLDGGVTASDVNLYWNINNGTMTQVP